MYFLLVFVIVTLSEWVFAKSFRGADIVLVTEVYYLNVALALYNTGGSSLSHCYHDLNSLSSQPWVMLLNSLCLGGY